MTEVNPPVFNPCPLCKTPPGATFLSTFGVYPAVLKCSTCGTYIASEGFLDIAFESSAFPCLSGMARERCEQGQRLLINAENYESLQKLAPQSAMSKTRKLLQAIARKSKPMGNQVVFDYNKDYPLAYCSGPAEFQFIFESLPDRGWIRMTLQGCSCTMTLSVFEEAESIIQVKSSQGFVAMWFNDEMKTIYDFGFYPAIGRLGYSPFRVDSKEHIGKIDDLIIAGIQESRFVVADFTGHRNGVYFEAGFAMGLGLPVIWTCRDDEIDKLHFDIRQYNCIKWSGPDDLKDKLTNRLRAVVGSLKS